MKIALRISVIVIIIIAVILWLRDDILVAFSLFRDRLTFPIAAGILFFTLICFINEPIRWLFILRNRSVAVSFSELYHLLTATALISYTLPARSGLPIRFFMTKKVLDVDYVIVGALLVVDSVLAYVSWLVVAVSGVFIILHQKNVFAMVLGLVVIAFGLIVFFCFTRMDWSRISRFKRLSNFAIRFSNGLKMMTIRVALINILLLFSDILFYGIRHTLILKSLGIQRPLISISLVVAISIFAGFASLMPLGLGGYDLSLVFLLTLLDVPKELALVVPIVNRIVMIGVGLILGVISLSCISLSREKSIDYSEKSKVIDKVDY